jgi:hypothetical protein
MLDKISKPQKRIVAALAITLLVWPAPTIMGEITKKNLVNDCDYFFQTVNQDLKKAEQDTQSWKYFNDASYFASQFTDQGMANSSGAKECFSRIGGGFREKVITFFGALVEHNRIANNYGTSAPPPLLPYKSAPEGSKVFGAFCDPPAPLLLKFHTNCVFFADMNENV